MAVADIMPVARRLWDFFEILHSDGNTDIDILKHGLLFCYFLIDFYRDFDLDLNLVRNWNSPLFKHLNLHWYVDNHFYLQLLRHFNHSFNHVNSRFVISLRYFENKGHHFINKFENLLRFCKLIGDLDELRHFNRDTLYIVFWYCHSF